MALSSSRLAYKDCEEFLELALDAPNGKRIAFTTSADAEYWRMRCNQFRSIDRQDNKSIHEIGMPLHGKSVYDEITMTLKHSPDGLFWVYAQVRKLNPEAVEDIPNDEGSLLAEWEEIKLLEDHNGDETPT
jgi:hypothetical protein